MYSVTVNVNASASYSFKILLYIEYVQEYI